MAAILCFRACSGRDSGPAPCQRRHHETHEFWPARTDSRADGRLLLHVTASPAMAQTSSNSRALVELNWMEVAELVPAQTHTVLLAVGTLEAHGITANGADILVPDSLAGRLAKELDALIAPTINYGVNTSLDEYPGTFGVSADLLRETAEQVMRGAGRDRL